MSLFKNFGFFLGTSFLLANTWAAEPRCLDSNTDDVDKFLMGTIQELGLQRSAIPEFLLLRQDVTLEFGASGIEKTIFADGFLSFDSGIYRLIPGLGITIEAKEDSLFYVCVQIKGQSSNNLLRIVHLERGGLLNRTFKTRPVPLSLRPLNEGILLIGGILKVLNIADPKKADRPKGPTPEKIVNELFSHIVRLGAEQVDIRPKNFEFTMVSQVFGAINITRTKHNFPVKSDWLLAK